MTVERSAAAAMPRHGRLALLVILLLIASALRFIALDNFPTPRGASPPGLEHDEVAHWLINQDILAGKHAVYFTDAYGHEALYHYAQAYFGALVGDNAFALRLPSAYLGILLVAVSYALGRRLLGPSSGLFAAAFLAVLFWPVFYSRLALRAISLPVLSGLSALFWWRASERQGRGPKEPPMGGRPTASFLLLLSGLLAGLSLHTYMAARAVPILYAAFTAYLLLFHRSASRKRWRGLLLFWLGLAVVALPLIWFLLANRGAEVRIAEVDAPLRALMAGHIRPVLENAVRIAGMFGFRGDPLWRQGIAGQAVFDPLLAVLFYAGVALSLWRWREPRHAFLLCWLGASVIPSLVTIDAPSSIRAINLLPVLILLPVLPVEMVLKRFVKPGTPRVIHFTPQLSTAWTKLSTHLGVTGAGGALVLLLLFHGWRTVDGLWRIWPANDEVRFVWQAALTEAAAYLDAVPNSGPVAVGGWTPDTMDPPTMQLTLRREDLSLRYFDPTTSLILPASTDGQPARIVLPAILPLATSLDALIGRFQQASGEFALYEVPARLDIAPQRAADIDFGGQLRFLGHDIDPACGSTSCTLTTYWQVTSAAPGPRRIFLHVVADTGVLVAQDDGLGAPAEYWQAGDLLIQLLTVETTAGELQLGVYDPDSGQRLPTPAGEEYVVLKGIPD